LRFSIAAHLHKAKALGSTGIALHHDLGTGDHAELTERLLKIAIAHRISQVANVEFIAHEWDS
jgi:hypothetical protein